METKDVTDLLITAIDKFKLYWNFYVVMLIALIGWTISIKKPLSASLKWMITLGYLVFVAMNFLGLYSSYTFAEALRSDLLAMEEAKTLTHTYNVLQNHSFVTQRTAVFWIHLILCITVLSVLWLGSFVNKKGEES